MAERHIIETYGPQPHNRNIWPYNSQATVFCHAWPILLFALVLVVIPLLPFPHKNNHYFRKEFLYGTFFTLFVLLRASDNTTSQNIGGTDARAVPPPQILGGPSPQSPLGLRPCWFP